MSPFILFFIIILIPVYFYFDHKKHKEIKKKELNIIHNQITKEQIIKEHYKKEITEVLSLEKEVNQKLVTLRTDIAMIEVVFHEIFKSIVL